MATRQQLQRWKARGTTTQRGLGASHQKRKNAMVPAAIGTLCPGPWRGRRSVNCVGIMATRAHMDLDEDPPRVIAPPVRWRICCPPCNRGAGATLGNRRRASTHPPVRPTLPVW
jgi:hypothetical protein